MDQIVHGKAGADLQNTPRPPLDGLKVLDLTVARAGPTAVRHLADWGAEVIRIDQPLPPKGSPANEDVVGTERSSDYQNLHRNKRSIRLDLKSSAGREIFLDLVRGADVVIENMRPGVKKRLRIAYEDLQSINPRLIYGSISGYGQTGPYRDRAGLDHIAQGMTGLMSVTGVPGGGPLRVGIAVGDLTAGNILALNLMIALFEREKTGRGRWVHTSLLESLLFMLDFQATRWLVDGEVPRSVGNEHPTGVPTDLFPTADGQINLTAPTPKMWASLCKVMEKPEWSAQEEWSTRRGRIKHRATIHAAIADVTRTRSNDYWIQTLNSVGIPCGPIYTMDQVFEDEQVKLLGLAAPVHHPELGTIRLVGSPMNFDGTEKRIRSATPDPGADAKEILANLGYGPEKIATLEENGII
ncbi:CaiB/baiF CoA-transferase [Caballeronia calidae]|uniref:CaiB/baiF CoA-transferase n=1 Tax=Caballeronia calidae TaxID=1777139 RepID=A0A158EFN4_9BURK|nr:CoA transferase [Caballeronia calidae]SAL05624.1 CaiB/baiF CoA-transferase [Caballeronia calidae]